ncbi:hypothetical protein GX586_07770, partial [bacterium]|nr:hypothetical protein [bacterium]
MERLHTHAALCLCALFLVLGASPAHALSRWTILVYLDGDNNLEPDGINDVNEMETVGSDSNVNIVVQFDRISGYDSSNGNWTDCRRAKIIKDGNTGTMGSFDLSLPTCAGIGEVNMGDPATLSNFVAWGMATYPAEQYMLVLWNHGGGWELAQAALAAAGGKTGHFKAVCWDDSSGGDCLYTREVRSALEHLPTLSVIGFDACLMAMIEGARELAPYADYFVASEEVEPMAGWAYGKILARLDGASDTSPRELAQGMVTDFARSY